MKELMEIKALLKSDELLYLGTYNKITGWFGCASFYTNGEAKIYVNEGDGSGCDDAGHIHMNWDNGSSLALIYNEDCFQIIPDECGTKFLIKGVANNKVLYFRSLTTDFPLFGTTWNIQNCSENLKDATLFNTIEEAESACEAIGSINFKIYPVCPRCHNEYDERPAISRYDNKTEICEKCGLMEGLWAFFEYEKKATNK